MSNMDDGDVSDIFLPKSSVSKYKILDTLLTDGIQCVTKSTTPMTSFLLSFCKNENTPNYEYTSITLICFLFIC